MKVEYKIAIERAKYRSMQVGLWGLGLVTGLSIMYGVYEAPKLFESNIITVERSIAHAEEKNAIETIIEWKTAEFSAYTASVDETDRNPNIMASGKRVYIGAIACPRDMTLGTVIELENGNRYTCEDRMNKRYADNFDIYMETKGEAFSFGRKSMRYRIIK